MSQVSVQEIGYLYIYLSYDNLTGADVYFDDLKIVVQESPVIQVNNYYPFGMVSYAWLREGEIDNAILFQGKELISQTGWHDFGSRMYWADLGRWFARDPQGQFCSPYKGMGNIPTMGRDPNGELFWLIPVAIGAILNTAANTDKIHDVWDALGYAAIGAAAGGTAMGISALGAGAWYAGAGAGLVGGSLTTGARTDWDGGLMLRNGLIGGLGGFVGGGVASAIGGGPGAFFGGAASDVTTQLVSTGNVDFSESGMAGLLSFGLYHGMTYASYELGGGDKRYNGQKLSYRQFAKLNTAFQRARFWRKEQGVYFGEKGSARLEKTGNSKFEVNWTDNRPTDVGRGHIHWAKPDKMWVDMNGDGSRFERFTKGREYPDESNLYMTEGNNHGQQDFNISKPSIVVGRTGSSYYYPGMLVNGIRASNPITPDPFVRLFIFPF